LKKALIHDCRPISRSWLRFRLSRWWVFGLKNLLKLLFPDPHNNRPAKDRSNQEIQWFRSPMRHLQAIHRGWRRGS
jgi:hypothetical protein